MKVYVFQQGGYLFLMKDPKTPTASIPVGTLEIEEPGKQEERTAMDDLLRQVSKFSQLAKRFEDGMLEFINRIPPGMSKKTVTKEAILEESHYTIWVNIYRQSDGSLASSHPFRSQHEAEKGRWLGAIGTFPIFIPTEVEK